ncbi:MULTISPECIES: GntR family transcriptional regulator [Brevibacillus]|uniref:Putative transcriptional regulator n=1 Tax=Brevibacillus parabrevis TaxID=54914 RepID=A0A4Y3PU32_BREPA|nr:MULTISPECIES: GntR family transcriptional regulator [Brevibacillus]NRQ56981.1 GntR family transcriptional regulator [Brevibacillus sp. HD1.4A]MDH6353162.1 GntR family transcriptional regulator [Brevibacillus sp. 1238]MED2254614.1 GntR family transcriptional regulator [Brevibacillus parabrevis]RNB93377.1 GntR family transcriptional regulator [Brevibacillus parabrevis]UED67885.1 GntR family transcriptional regulator [Brevibacillus sp. HD3.3A]
MFITNPKKGQNDSKVLRYIKAYNEILHMIQSGLYPENSKLPSETDLSQMLGISRMTLRQALLLLQEDGFIVMRHGSGSYVSKTPNVNHAGLEKKTNPVYKCSQYEIELATISYRIDVPNDYVINTLGKIVPWVMGVDRLYEHEKRARAYGFTMIPYDTFEAYSINYAEEAQLAAFVDEQIYEYAHSTKLEIKFVKGNDLIKTHKMPSQNNWFVLILEVIYDKTGNILMHNKFFVPEEDAQLTICTY